MKKLKTFEGYFDNYYGSEYTSTSSKHINLPSDNEESEIKSISAQSKDVITPKDIEEVESGSNIEPYRDKHGVIKYKTINEYRLIAYELYNYIKDNDLIKLEELLKIHDSRVLSLIVRTVTLLMFATKNGNLDAVKLLLKYGADINAKGGGIYNTLTSLVAINDKSDEHIEILKYLLDQPGINIEYNTKYGTPLLIAISLLKRKSIVNNIIDMTPTFETIDLLLKYGADPYAKKTIELFSGKKEEVDAFELAEKTTIGNSNDTSNKYNADILILLNKYYSKNKYNL